MKYHAPTKCFVVEPKALEGAVLSLRYAMRHIRQMGGFPLEPHKRDGAAMTPACHAEKALIDMAADLGIDLGGTRAGQVDLRDS